MLRSKGMRRGLAALLVCVVLLAGLLIPAVRQQVKAFVPPVWIVQLNGLRFSYRVDHDVRIRMPDGVHLATSLYLPRGDGKLAAVLVRLPYDRLAYTEGLNAAEFFARHGYAVLVQDLRGTHASEGEFAPYRHGTSDGAATLDWITAQTWSNGRVGTYGCSALGETQLVLARAHHPAHRAMIPLGAGGAVGSAAGRYAYFGVFEGGIFELASGFGWFLEHGAASPRAAPAPQVDIAAALRTLPLSGMVQRQRPGPNSFEDFVRTPLVDPWWRTLDYVMDDDSQQVPALVITTWGDQTVGDSLSLAEAVRRRSPPETAQQQHVVVAPGTHCHSEETGRSGRFGDIEVRNAEQPYFDWYLRWFDHWLRDRGDGLAELPPYLVYMIGEAQWLHAGSWPPPEAVAQRWYLDSGGHANSARGDGGLRLEAPPAAAHDEYRADPMNPVPSRGGPVCCTGNPADREGPVDQRGIEQREDMLVYTSPVLEHSVRIAGPLRAVLKVSSSAPDTDVVARLVHVWPDGRATGIQEGALRARYRAGFDKPALMTPSAVVELSVDMRSIAYRVPKGHRLRLDIASSSFPRLERNLNTGGRNFDERVGVVAVNRVHHGGDALSFVELPVLPADD